MDRKPKSSGPVEDLIAKSRPRKLVTVGGDQGYQELSGLLLDGLGTKENQLCMPNLPKENLGT